LSALKNWQEKAQELKTEIHALYLASRDRRVPLSARILALCIIGYALSPIDLIPDFIPVLGLLDDLVLIPLGILILIRMIPADLMAEHREKAKALGYSEKPRNWVAAVLIIALWLVSLALLFRYAALHLKRPQAMK
jgi:uncharacterized membrane protein YkvA (DUF1232 family)